MQYKHSKPFCPPARILPLIHLLTDDAKKWYELHNEYSKLQDKDSKEAREATKKANEYLWRGSRLEKVIEQREAINLDEDDQKKVKQFIDESIKFRGRQLVEEREKNEKLTKALKESQIREQSARVWKLLSTNQASDALALAIKTMGDNLAFSGKELSDLAKSPGVILGVVQESLYKAMTEARVANMCEEHKGSVYSVAFSPNGEMIASGSADHTIRLWDIKSNPRLWDIKGNPIGQELGKHGGSVTSIAFSPDGKMIASGSNDRTIRLWDIKGNPIGQELGKHKGDVLAVAFSPDGKMIVSGSADETIRLWKIDDKGNFNLDKRWRRCKNSVNSVAFSPDGKMIVSGSADETIRLWKIDDKGNFNLDKTLRGHDNDVLSVAFSPDGKMIVSGSADETIRLWKIDDKGNFNLDKILRGHSKSVRSVAFSRDGKMIVSGSADKTLRLWDINAKLIGQPFYGHKYFVYSVAFSPDGETIVSGSQDNTLALWDIKGNSIGQPLCGHEGSVYSVAFSPDEKMIASGSADHTIRLWDINGEPNGQILGDCESSVKSLAFSPDGTILASAGDDQTVYLWDINKRTLNCKLTEHTNWVTSVAFSPDGKILASGSDDKTVCLWDIDDAKLICKLEEHKDCVKSVAFSPDGKILASGTGCQDSEVYLWDTEKKSLIHKIFCGKDNNFNSVTFSPDGKMIACGCSNKKISLRNTEGKAINEDFLGHEDEVNSVTFSPDGQMIVSGSKDKNIRLWDIKGNPLDPPWYGHEDAVNCVAFSPNGEMIVSGSNDRTIRLWRSGLKAWFKVCCDRLAPLVLKEPEFFIHEDRECEACAKYELWSITKPEFGRILIEQGKKLIEWKCGEKSCSKFKKAIEDNSKLEKEAIEDAQKQVHSLLKENLRYLKLGQIKEGNEAYKEAEKLQELDKNIIKAEHWNNLCWYGSLYKSAQDPYVREACKRAIEADPENTAWRDTLGINRALNDDFKGAIEEFQAFIDSADDGTEKSWREKWVCILNDEQNPFTEKEINEIIQYYKKDKHLRRR